MASSLSQGFPVSCSASRTALGWQSAAGPSCTSWWFLAMVLLTLLVAGPLLSGFPKAALGALVIFAAVRPIDVGDMRRIARFRRNEFLLAVLTTVGVLGLGVLYGVLAASALSIVELLRRVARPHDSILGYVPGMAGMHDVDDYPLARQVPGLVVYRYERSAVFRQRRGLPPTRPGGRSTTPRSPRNSRNAAVRTVVIRIPSNGSC